MIKWLGQRFAQNCASTRLSLASTDGCNVTMTGPASTGDWQNTALKKHEFDADIILVLDQPLGEAAHYCHCVEQALISTKGWHNTELEAESAT